MHDWGNESMALYTHSHKRQCSPHQLLVHPDSPFSPEKAQQSLHWRWPCPSACYCLALGMVSHIFLLKIFLRAARLTEWRWGWVKRRFIPRKFLIDFGSDMVVHYWGLNVIPSHTPKRWSLQTVASPTGFLLVREPRQGSAGCLPAPPPSQRKRMIYMSLFFHRGTKISFCFLNLIFGGWMLDSFHGENLS